jgi:hypothetical protein
MTISTRTAWSSHQHSDVRLLTLALIPVKLQETHWGRGVTARHRFRRFFRGGVMLKKIRPVGVTGRGGYWVIKGTPQYTRKLNGRKCSPVAGGCVVWRAAAKRRRRRSAARPPALLCISRSLGLSPPKQVVWRGM